MLVHMVAMANRAPLSMSGSAARTWSCRLQARDASKVLGRRSRFLARRAGHASPVTVS